MKKTHSVNITLKNKALRMLVIPAVFLCANCSIANPNMQGEKIYTPNNIQGLYYSSETNAYTLEHNYKDNSSMIYLNVHNHRTLTLSDEDIGHQGFGVLQYRDNKTKYIITGEKQSALTALLFKIDNENGHVRKNILTLFPDSFSQHNETMPTLSSDGKYLIARGRKSEREMVIRVFDFQKIKDSANTDFSNDYMFEWPISSADASARIGSLQPLQAIASNGHEIALLFGNARLTPKVIYFYTLDGHVKNLDGHVTQGMTEAKKHMSQNFYEPEGISYKNQNDLKILITSGKGRDKENVIYDYH